MSRFTMLHRVKRSEREGGRRRARGRDLLINVEPNLRRTRVDLLPHCLYPEYTEDGRGDVTSRNSRGMSSATPLNTGGGSR